MEKVVERWGRDGELTASKSDGDSSDLERQDPSSIHISDRLLSLDTDAFGVSRKGLLQLLSRSGSGNITSDGYVLSRPGRTARHLGPCVANSDAEARQLIAGHLEDTASAREEHEGTPSQGWYWDLVPANAAAVRCAESLGFTRRRVLWRMRRGEMMENNDAMVYAIAGFELG